MYALSGIVALLVFVYLRPHEFVPALENVPFLYLAVGGATLGFVADVAMGRSRLEATPHTGWTFLFWTWAIVSSVVMVPGTLAQSSVHVIVALAVFLVVAHGVQSMANFERIAALILAMTVVLAVVGTHQGFAPLQCVRVEMTSPTDANYIPDGRSCESSDGCYDVEGGGVEGARYNCEHVGLFGTTSIGLGRVRYRGILQDPNELAMVLAIGLPFAFAFRERKPSLSRTLVLLAIIGITGVCIVFTRSRGGQLVLAAVLATYFVKKRGFRGAIVAAILAAPVLLLGGRSGEEASQSTVERAEAWYEGLQMFRESPLFGVGYDQFQQRYYLTAHNSFVLSLAELGLVGLLLFVANVYLSLKIAWTAMRRAGEGSEAEATRTWGMALVATWVGLSVGMFFLSFAYHYVLWIYMGLATAFHAVARATDPGFRIRLGFADLLAVGALAAVLLGLIVMATRLAI